MDGYHRKWDFGGIMKSSRFIFVVKIFVASLACATIQSYGQDSETVTDDECIESGLF
jgi:hypothetical protein